jgi:hypothetical protein
MKRLLLSLLGGFAVPFLYSIIVGPVTPYIKNEAINQLAMYPVRWPVLILYRLGLFPVRSFQDEPVLLLYIIVGNVFLYTFLTYVVLWGVSRRKVLDRLPPKPEQPV